MQEDAESLSGLFEFLVESGGDSRAATECHLKSLPSSHQSGTGVFHEIQFNFGKFVFSVGKAWLGNDFSLLESCCILIWHSGISLGLDEYWKSQCFAVHPFTVNIFVSGSLWGILHSLGFQLGMG